LGDRRHPPLLLLLPLQGEPALLHPGHLLRLPPQLLQHLPHLPPPPRPQHVPPPVLQDLPPDRLRPFSRLLEEPREERRRAPPRPRRAGHPPNGLLRVDHPQHVAPVQAPVRRHRAREAEPVERRYLPAAGHPRIAPRVDQVRPRAHRLRQVGEHPQVHRRPGQQVERPLHRIDRVAAHPPGVLLPSHHPCDPLPPLRVGLVRRARARDAGEHVEPLEHGRVGPRLPELAVHEAPPAPLPGVGAAPLVEHAVGRVHGAARPADALDRQPHGGVRSGGGAAHHGGKHPVCALGSRRDGVPPGLDLRQSGPGAGEGGEGGDGGGHLQLHEGVVEPEVVLGGAPRDVEEADGGAGARDKGEDRGRVGVVHLGGVGGEGGGLERVVVVDELDLPAAQCGVGRVRERGKGVRDVGMGVALAVELALEQHTADEPRAPERHVRDGVRLVVRGGAGKVLQEGEESGERLPLGLAVHHAPPDLPPEAVPRKQPRPAVGEAHRLGPGDLGERRPGGAGQRRRGAVRQEPGGVPDGALHARQLLGRPAPAEDVEGERQAAVQDGRVRGAGHRAEVEQADGAPRGRRVQAAAGGGCAGQGGAQRAGQHGAEGRGRVGAAGAPGIHPRSPSLRRRHVCHVCHGVERWIPLVVGMREAG
ncbi:hypothetical protein DFJ74DRAFT_746993, partial [Hyaloraphidium curvatum]